MIQTAEAGSLRVIRLDRPGLRNALTRDGIDELQATVETVEKPVIYLTGSGPAFCAGADLDTVRGLEGDRDAAREFVRAGQSMLDSIESSDSVVVVGVDGAARGGGVELALAADVRLATPEATFAEPGVELGIFGAWGGTRRLPAAVGETHALDLSLSGRTIGAIEARDIGLVSRVVDDPRTVAASIAEQDSNALSTVKHLLRDQSEQAEQERREADAFADRLAAGLN